MYVQAVYCSDTGTLWLDPFFDYLRNAGVSSEVSPVEDGGFPRTWNQVFRVRFSRQLPQQVNGGESEKDQTPEWEEGTYRCVWMNTSNASTCTLINPVHVSTVSMCWLLSNLHSNELFVLIMKTEMECQPSYVYMWLHAAWYGFYFPVYVQIDLPTLSTYIHALLYRWWKGVFPWDCS